MIRKEGIRGFCGETDKIRISRAALHMWEEPCISGEEGSGTVFFTGCNMRCVFCQNYRISNGEVGKEITEERLAAIFLELQEQNANNINLVTPTHFVPQVIRALEAARRNRLMLPVVYNTSGYESVDTLKMLEGYVDIYLPDFKYLDTEHAKRYSGAGDYPEVAKAANLRLIKMNDKIVRIIKKYKKHIGAYDWRKA